MKPTAISPSKQLRADTVAKSPRTKGKDSITTMLPKGTASVKSRRKAAKKTGLWA